jgi:hypothetical protein
VRRTHRLVAIAAGALSLGLFAASCGHRVPYHPDEPEVLHVSGIDIDQTLDVAEYRLAHLDKFQSLGLWIMRDQVVTPAQAKRISTIYFANIDSMNESFDVWHFTWAIRNLHDEGSAEVQRELAEAHADARERAKLQGGIADKMVNGTTLYHGDFHGLARGARKDMMVVPGDGDYTQSFEQFRRKHQSRYERKREKSGSKPASASSRPAAVEG